MREQNYSAVRALKNVYITDLAAFLPNKPVSNEEIDKILGVVKQIPTRIENISCAGEMETCMYAGAKKNSDGSITGWREFPSPEDAVTNGAFLIQQDVKLLNDDIMYVSVDKTLPFVIKKHGLSASQVDWLLPHYSSGYFRQRYYDQLKEFRFEVPFEKWFTNLSYKGNTGAASMYIILEEFFHSGKLKKGQKILCYIPESARFSICYVMLTVV